MQGVRISRHVWAAVALGLTGSLLVAYDGLAGSGSTTELLTMAGDGESLKGTLLVSGACFFYRYGRAVVCMRGLL